MSLLMSQTNSLQSLQRLSQWAVLMVYSYVFISFVCNPRWASFTGSSSFIFFIAWKLVNILLEPSAYFWSIWWNDRIFTLYGIVFY